jgi:hypothetical protein
LALGRDSQAGLWIQQDHSLAIDRLLLASGSRLGLRRCIDSEAIIKGSLVTRPLPRRLGWSGSRGDTRVHSWLGKAVGPEGGGVEVPRVGVEATRGIQQGLGGELAEGVFLGRREDHSGTIGQAIEDHRTHDEGLGDVLDERYCTVGLSEQHTIRFNHLVYRSRAKSVQVVEWSKRQRKRMSIEEKGRRDMEKIKEESKWR